MVFHRDRRAMRQSAKSGPPLRDRLGNSAGGVATLARGPTGPRYAPLLPGGLPKTITVIPTGREVPLAAARRRWAAELLHYWFHTLRPGDWFRPGERIDADLRRRFACDLAMLRARPAREFLRDPLTARAAVLLFDQVPRNVRRGTAEAFATDPLARAIAHGIVARGWDRTLGKAERQFVAMPLMHSEAIADQRASLAAFARLGWRHGLPFARGHYRMIARFGRFPHRNAILGRRSTAAERKAIAAGFVW